MRDLILKRLVQKYEFHIVVTTNYPDNFAGYISPESPSPTQSQLKGNLK